MKGGTHHVTDACRDGSATLFGARRSVCILGLHHRTAVHGMVVRGTDLHRMGGCRRRKDSDREHGQKCDKTREHFWKIGIAQSVVHCGQ